MSASTRPPTPKSLGKPAQARVDTDALLDNPDICASVNDGEQGSLHLAVMDLRPVQVLELLKAKVDPNNRTGQQSFIAYAMYRHVNSRKLAKEPENFAASEQICFALLDHGARLGHVPALDHKGTPPALRDVDLWHKPVFAAQVLFRAMDYAIAHDRNIPYLSINNLYSALDAGSPQRAADTALRAFEDVARVQKQVVTWLDKPVDEITERVAAKLPAENRAFWYNAVAAAGSPIGELKL